MLKKGERTITSTYKKNGSKFFTLIFTICLSFVCQQSSGSYTPERSAKLPSPSSLSSQRKVSFHENPDVLTYQADETYITKHLSTKDLPQTSRTLTQDEVNAKVLLRAARGNSPSLTTSNLIKLQESLGINMAQPNTNFSVKSTCSKETQTDDEQLPEETNEQENPIEIISINRAAVGSPPNGLSCCHQ
ncbi:MAG: hypothetical protein NTU89_02985 [Candidatus Dependentiae bacterium]|nr:hypothetical protein [Candidatus Dependentiae bacterium]